MFTEAQLISFGNFLLKNYGVQVHSTDGKNVPIYQREVTDADFCNWEETQNSPSISLGQPVWFRLWSADIIGEVLSIHHHEGKVKYDLKLIGHNGETTRIYNVDSTYVVSRIEK
ncbi:MAG: hypothetical protein ACHQFX_21870 [Chitinophagales bacterium]